MKRVSFIIFSHKRALQLDFLLNSILSNFVNLELPIHIIYDWSKDHEKSYVYLQNKYRDKNIIFNISIK